MSDLIDAMAYAVHAMQHPKKPLILFDTIEQDLALEVLKVYIDFSVEFRYHQMMKHKGFYNWSWTNGYIRFGFSYVECFDCNDRPAPIMSFEEFNGWFQTYNS